MLHSRNVHSDGRQLLRWATTGCRRHCRTFRVSDLARAAYVGTVPGSIQSIERAAAILRTLATGSGPLRLAEISTSLHLSKGTAHGILRTLAEVGFVDQDRDT